MFTLIEIFDSKQYENILSPICLDGISKLIYVGTKEVMTAKKIADLKNFFAYRKYSVPIEFLYIERDNSRSVMNRFSQIIKNNRNCIFDATGGEDVILASVGIASERFSVPVIRINTKSGKYVLVHGTLNNVTMNKPSLTPEDFIILQGGKLLRHSVVSHFSQSEITDIKNMFSVNCADCEAYSTFCSFAAEFVSDDGSKILFNRSDYFRKNSLTGGKFDSVINLLCKKKLLTDISTASSLTYEIKNSVVSRCIMKAGNALEYYTALALQSLENIFSHIKLGATIEWNDKAGFFETQNEIDVLAIADGVPVFISCKNGEVKKDALYELDAVSRALGGTYAKKVLVCTHISKNTSARDHFIKRARDMGIGLVYDTHKKTYDDFLHFLKLSID